MAVATFDALCTGLCELLGVRPPALQADDQGLVAFHILLHGQAVNIVHRPHQHPEHAFILFELGPLGQSGDGHAETQALLDANFDLFQLHAPAFSRNPANGEAVLQFIVPLFDATPESLRELVEEGAAWSADWRSQLARNDEADAPVLPMAMPNMA